MVDDELDEGADSDDKIDPRFKGYEKDPRKHLEMIAYTHMEMIYDDMKWMLEREVLGNSEGIKLPGMGKKALTIFAKAWSTRALLLAYREIYGKDKELFEHEERIGQFSQLVLQLFYDIIVNDFDSPEKPRREGIENYFDCLNILKETDPKRYEESRREGEPLLFNISDPIVGMCDENERPLSSYTILYNNSFWHGHSKLSKEELQLTAALKGIETFALEKIPIVITGPIGDFKIPINEKRLIKNYK
ncbi:MAG: hypothetical protein AABY22_15870 [Nanoarchaeota archaeon]